ncbi:cation diffusion facilitator family transporter [Microseira sp. BLCC-F43]|jgi:cobalt-zinc-cadmium efflux system protein|uniref:cation diffusion facilitator family transporter n=1 Tax=Microseira sp. BLCC-F43 TaxID=3153602 RepID=UPI0035B7E2B0
MTYSWHYCDSPNCIGWGQMDNQQRFRLTVMLVAILLFAIVEWLAGYLSHSLALRADAWHMVADGGAILLALSASWLTRWTINRRWSRQPRPDAIAAFLNSVGLLLMAGLIAWEAIGHLTLPPQQILSQPMLIAATIGLVINIIGIALLHKDSQGNLNVRGAFLHILADLASSVGVMLGAISIYAFQCFWLDGIISLLIALFIAGSSLPLMRSSWQQLGKNSPDVNELTLLEIGKTNLRDLIVRQSD